MCLREYFLHVLLIKDHVVQLMLTSPGHAACRARVGLDTHKPQ